MRTALAAAILTFATGCAPRILWHGANAERTARAELLSSFTGQRLRTGDTVGPRFDAISPDSIIFSSASGRVAYAGQRDQQWFMVVDGIEHGPWDGLSEPRFSPDGERFVFLARRSAAWRVVIDGVETGPWPGIQAHSLRFSPNGAHLAWVVPGKTCSRLVVDGRRFEPCREEIFPLRVLDIGAVATVIAEGGKHRFLLDEALGPPVDEIGEWLITPDGAHVAYAARTGQRWTAVIDGVAQPPCDAVTRLRFGNHGRAQAYVCREDNWSRLVLNGASAAPFRAVRFLRLARNTARFALVASDERGVWVMTDANQHGPYATVTDYAFDPDTGELAFVARKAGQAVVVHRGTETALERTVEGSLVLSEDGEHWAAIAGEAQTRSLYACVDGRRIRTLSADDVFGEASPRLRAWMARLLKEELDARSAR